MPRRLSDVRLSQLSAGAHKAARSYSDPQTGMYECRVLEAVAAFDELVVSRIGSARAAQALLDIAPSLADGHVRGRLRAIAEALLEAKS